MKNLIMFIALSSIVWSCSHDQISDSPSSIDSNESIELKNSRDTLDVLTLEDIDNMFKEEFKDYEEVKISNKLEIDGLKNKSLLKDENLNRSPTLNGPFTVNAVQSLVFSNKKILFSGGQGGLATGIYICDIYKFQSVVSIPLNGAPAADLPTPSGYISASSQTVGINEYTNTTQTSKQYVIATWMINVKYNLNAQFINIDLPNTLQNGFDYTYYYFTL
ncbi:hypothetical protein ESY86_15310 [Subsaximicrobium wynnwilliamsii]|uniref:Uncharacterized protein n=1 Tax=Subsaximicrobium wynnwilliamsii TaxID=291179 RepID=A0A5C6ZF31_9FLAO|nr:hypothetical protein [Subsaximicrobium wynnwilliamsii]TXD82198.1 hypothetical protein ESY87_14900 [Subsaximicrobium wynnwilliamsii]TXD87838.1 hypothetical protein ESY86_15310 [Subsaximicrobium wynnwilliamsii]TXE01788.1 hypothetical protein ESY88_14475 [Subsaximicrobium wynnwilliamsii]